MISFKDADVEQMRTVQSMIVSSIMPFRDRVEAALVIFALMRCARTLLRLYPAKTQRWLVPLLIAFLQGKTEAPKGLDGESTRILTLN